MKRPDETTCNPCIEHPAWKHPQEPEEGCHHESLDGKEEEDEEDEEDKEADLVAECALGGLGVGVEYEGVRDFHLVQMSQQYSRANTSRRRGFDADGIYPCCHLHINPGRSAW